MHLGKSISPSQVTLRALPIIPACPSFLMTTDGRANSLRGPPGLWASTAWERGMRHPPSPTGSLEPLFPPTPTPPQGLSYLMSESQAGSCHCELCCDSQADSFTTNTLKAPGTGAPGCGTDFLQPKSFSQPLLPRGPAPPPLTARNMRG